MSKKNLAHFSAGRIIISSLFVAIFCGTTALMLPLAQTQPLAFIDVLFTAVSATCVTGLLTIPLSSFTPFGHAIILLLIQIGGLGLITLTLFILSLFINFGLTTQVMAVKLLEIEQQYNIKKLILFIMMVTLTAESLGAGILFLSLRHQFPLGKALFLSIFHAISSFCNAGITLFDHDMIEYATNAPLLITTMALILTGGLGFITWLELFEHFKQRRRKKVARPFSLHSKIVLLTTPLLIAISTTLLYLFEINNSFSHLEQPFGLLNALFTAISTRCTGLLTVPFTTMSSPSIFTILFITFVGASPGSTGSGIKITTLFILLATVKAAISGRNAVEIKGRQIPKDQVYKAMTIALLSFIWISITTLLLLITEQNFNEFALIFEATSAFTTLGISSAITPHLSFAGKIIITISMIVGRLGSLTMILALKKSFDVQEFSYPEERVMLT